MSFENQNQDVLNMIQARCMALNYKNDKDGLTDEEAAEYQRLDKKFVELSRRVPTDTVGYGSQAQTRDSIDDRSGQINASRVFGDAGKAQAFVSFCAAIAGNRDAENQFQELTGLSPFAAHAGGDNVRGGYLVPVILQGDILRLVRDYGTFRRNCQVVTMTSDTLYVPRRTTGLTTYYVAEGSAIPETVAAFDQVGLHLKKLAGIARISNELAEDAIISVADLLAEEFAHALAIQEDTAGWVGTGAAATGGIVGVVQKLTDSAADCTVQAGGAAWTDYALADFVEAIGKVHSKAHAGSKWYCTPPFFGSVMLRLASAAGGTSLFDLQHGIGKTFLGFKVELVEVLPRSTGASQYDCVFGDLSMAAMMGVAKSGLRLEKSTSANIGGESMFERDQSALRMTSRYDVNVHSVGDANEPSPLVVMRTA